MTPWYAIQVRPSAEKKVATALKEHGIEGFVPVEKFWRGIGSRRRTAERPLIRGYVFAQLGDQDRALLHDVDGATCVITIHPRRVEAFVGFIAELRILEAGGKFDATADVRRPPRKAKGAMVRITDGHYTGFLGVIMKMKGEARARVMLTIFGEDREVVFGFEKMESAEDPEPERRAA
jgi:transcription antitermination factor NusG